MTDWPARVGVLGAAGLVGSGVAAALATSGGCRELHVVDPKTDLLRAHAIDIAEAQLAAGGATTGSGRNSRRSSPPTPSSTVPTRW